MPLRVTGRIERYLTAPKQLIYNQEFRTETPKIEFLQQAANAPNDEGCLTVCSGKISPEQAEYNVLYVYFYGTPVATFFGGVPGAAPLNYLQIYSDDILYAEANSKSPVDIVQIDGAPLVISAQDLMNLASQKLFEIAEPPAGR